ASGPGAEDLRDDGIRFGPGATGTIGYLAKMFPRISESFILNEVLALRRHGLDVRVYSILPPTRDSRMHDEALSLLDEVYIIPEFHWRNIGSFLLALGRCFRRRPRITRRATWRLIMRGPSRRKFKRFFRAIYLADRMHRDRVAHMHAAWAHTPASVGVLASKINGTPWSMSGHAKDIYLANPDSLKKNLHLARYTTTCTKTNVSFLREKGIHED